MAHQAPTKGETRKRERTSMAMFNIFSRRSAEEVERAKIQRAWDRERSRAMTPSQRQEIDAIFARHI